VGYLCGKTYFAGLLKSGNNLPIPGGRSEGGGGGGLSTLKTVLNSKNYNKQFMPEASPHYTFTDLAQMVCKEPKYEDEGKFSSN
jgi:hypothetical protein